MRLIMKATLFILGLVALRPAAHATTVVALTESQMTERADTILLGTVMGSQTLVDDHGQVTTRAWLQVDQGMRGAQGGDIVPVDVPGGRLPNGLVAVVDGAPELHSGQMVFGFFETFAGVRHPLGLSYGVYHVTADKHHALFVRRNLTGLNLVSMAGASAGPDVVHVNREPLEALMERVSMRLNGAQ